MEFNLLDVGFFKTQALLAVYHLQHKTEQQGGNAEAGQHDQRSGVVELRGVSDAGIGGVEHLADEQGEQPQADVLNLEDKGVG